MRHVTLLSARGVELAPPEQALRATELDLAGRTKLTHSIVRPGWFMQNFDEFFFQPAIAADGVIVAPTGDGAEAFVHADDIADVAAATLLAPAEHAGAAYALSGPEALTFEQVAERIAAAAGRPVRHVDPPVEQWVAGAAEGGHPARLRAAARHAVRQRSRQRDGRRHRRRPARHRPRPAELRRLSREPRDGRGVDRAGPAEFRSVASLTKEALCIALTV